MKKVFRNLFVIAMSITAITTVSFVVSSCEDDDDEITEKEVDIASLGDTIIGIWQRQDNNADSTIYLTFKSSGIGTKTVIKKDNWGYETSFSYFVAGKTVAITDNGKKVFYEVMSLTNKKITMRNVVYLYDYYKVSSIPNYDASIHCVCYVSYGDITLNEGFHIDWTGGDCNDVTLKYMPEVYQDADMLECYEEY